MSVTHSMLRSVHITHLTSTRLISFQLNWVRCYG